MATITASSAASTKPVSGHGFANNRKQAVGIYPVTASLAASTVIQMCRVPKGAVVTGGWLRGTVIEVTANTLDIDVGYEDNGTDAVDLDAFGNFGTLSSTVIVGSKPEQGYAYPLAGVLMTAGPKTLAAETIISLTVNASATTWTSGVLSLVVDYYLP
jgi:hypothetical protein